MAGIGNILGPAVSPLASSATPQSQASRNQEVSPGQAALASQAEAAPLVPGTTAKSRGASSGKARRIDASFESKPSQEKKDEGEKSAEGSRNTIDTVA